MRTTAKFGAEAAERWSEREYANEARYLEHRAELVRELGAPLVRGDRVLELACGDAALAEFLLPHGLAYLGVDASAPMVAAARARLGTRAELVHADLNDYRPPGPVAATAIFRAIYYTVDRADFFRRVAGFTQKKLVFDLDPRRYRLETVAAELVHAGFAQLDVRPFFVPQKVALPAPLLALLVAAERTGPLARTILRLRFSYVCVASR